MIRTAAAALVLFAAPNFAQFNDRWASFEPAPGAISAAGAISDDANETDLAWGDLDLDGDGDLVVARKEPFTTAGKRTNVLLVNEAGVLTDRTATLASASDFAGDLGFLTPTNDRDIAIADLNGDGYPEVITAADMGDGEPKHVSHPRVYLNLGVGAAWSGLRYEESRVPQLLHNTSGIPLDPRFTAVQAGDLNNDGFVDLYFGDHDTGLTLFGALQPASEDTDDRLLVNDGLGFFTDGSLSAMPAAMLDSNFCNSVALGDFNQDGTTDVLKQVTYGPPDSVRLAYNDPTSPGSFVFQDTVHVGSPYFINAGDLNADGRLDVAVTQNAPDVFLVNEATAPSGLVSWSAPQGFELLSGSKAGFSYSSNNQITDLDGDGWNEVVIADVDPEFPQYQDGFYTRIYHNRGGTVGGADIVLREERASTDDDDWVGVDGPTYEDLRWTHDVAVFDVDGDTRQDLVLSRREGTQVWRQVAPPVCQVDLGFGAGAPVLEVCGGDLTPGSDATLRLFAAEAGAPTFLAVGFSANPVFVPQVDATLVPFPPAVVLTLATDAGGELALPVASSGAAATLVVQALVADPGLLGFEASNAVEVELLP